jgi:hypothetical protein
MLQRLETNTTIVPIKLQDICSPTAAGNLQVQFHQYIHHHADYAMTNANGD